MGTGNLAGVAVALTLGGPGAIFWMWMVAIVGMATAYAESTLAQLYKVQDKEGQFRGGPAQYIIAGLKMPILAHAFAIALIFCSGLVFSAVQSNSIASAMEEAFEIPELATGLVVTVLAGFIIFGGIRKIAQFAVITVPFMAAAYVIVTFGVVLLNIEEVPSLLLRIISSAFGFDQAAGGVTGGMLAAMSNGIRRGLYSNEAGMGTVPNIAASTSPSPHHPATQGFTQAVGVFIDTIVICTATALLILLSGAYEPGGALTGIALTQAAASEHLGSAGSYFIAVAILFFAFTTIVANFSYAENVVFFLSHGRSWAIPLLRIGALSMVLWGSLQSVTTVFNSADAAMGFMATINLFALTLLLPKVVALTKDYFKYIKAGQQPKFDISEHPDLAEGVNSLIWTEKHDPPRTTKKN